MSIYQDEIFNYLTKRDNFMPAYDIYQMFPNVKNTLISQFWPIVKSTLQELISEPDWKIDLAEDISIRYSKLSVSINDSFYVVFEGLDKQPFFGLLIDFDNNTLDRPRINEHAKNFQAIQGMKKSDWYLGYTLTGENFDNIETLKRILPENREVLAKEFATLLFELAYAIKEDAFKMDKMKKP